MIGGNHSALNPAGPLAAGIAGLTNYMIAVLGAAYVLTMAFVFLAVLRGRRDNRPDTAKGRRIVLTFGLVLPAAAFFSILVYSVSVGRMMGTAPYSKAPVIEVTGKQWWWQVRYFEGGNLIAETANEIHVPAGRPMKFKLQSSDVIHSFWVPNLSGKMDMIPGRTNEIWIRADREGVWRGECAEFCGPQHAHMHFEVIAENPAKYSKWLDWQKQPAVQPASALGRQGQEVFVNGPCVMCHKVGGTPAGGSAGPNLTHVAGRRKIAAGMLANTRGHLGGWIVNTQGIKPGNRMPRLTLEPDQMEALLEYLGALQ